MLPNQTVVHMKQAFKLALSMVLLYWLALSLNWDMPKYGALAIALVSLDTTGASLNKGIMRIVGTSVGLGVGLFGLALLAQDSWLTLLYHACYVAFVGYHMQSSRYPYAWFVAGFLPSLVWATTYGKIDNAFSYATFRYLETTAGIVIYTAVSSIVWPQRAGDTLNRQGQEYWQQFQELFDLYRRQLEEGNLSADAPARQSELAGTATRMFATLEAAYADTPAVSQRKRAWESFRVNTRDTGDAMELWRQSIDDCRHLDLDRVLPRVNSMLEKLERRFARIDSLWPAPSTGVALTDTGDRDEALLEHQKLELASDQAGKLSHFQRAALLNFAKQLSLFDLTSSKLLLTMRVLSGVSQLKVLDSRPLPADLHRLPWWDTARIANASLPAVSFVVAWYFWIYFNPPTGPSVPSMAVTFGLMAVMTPMNVLRLIPPVFVVVLAFVAPVYFLIMPRLSTGPELLTLVFAFAFAAKAMLVGRLAAVGTLTLSAFVMMTGISNDQSYSFAGIVSGAMMLLLGLVIVGIVQSLVSPVRPEQAMLKDVRRFFRGCARVLAGYGSDDHANRSHRRSLQTRYFESTVLPASTRVQATTKQLDYKQFPDNPPENVQLLVDGLQSIAKRLHSLEISQQQFSAHAMRLPQSFSAATDQIRSALQRVFERWATFEPGDAMEHQRAELRRLARDLELQFDALEAIRGQQEVDDHLLSDLYTMIGTVRGLVEAMATTQSVIAGINWHAWAKSRF